MLGLITQMGIAEAAGMRIISKDNTKENVVALADLPMILVLLGCFSIQPIQDYLIPYFSLVDYTYKVASVTNQFPQ